MTVNIVFPESDIFAFVSLSADSGNIQMGGPLCMLMNLSTSLPPYYLVLNQIMIIIYKIVHK